MANNPRAKQFMPFDALKGFKEALKEKEKIIVPKKELTSFDIDNLNYKFTQIKKGQMLKVIYYDQEDYIEIEGIITKIDFTNRYIVIVKDKILFDDIYDIFSKKIKEQE